MTLALRKLVFDQLTEPDKAGIRELSPDLILGIPRVMNDGQGRKWETYTSGQFTPIQIAMTAAVAVNRQALIGYDSPSVDNDTAEVLDRGAWHEEIKALLQDPDAVAVPMTLPEDVVPSDPEREYATLKDIALAQEGVEGELDGVLRVDPDQSEWSDVEPELP